MKHKLKVTFSTNFFAGPVMHLVEVEDPSDQQAIRAAIQQDLDNLHKQTILENEVKVTNILLIVDAEMSNDRIREMRMEQAANRF